MSFTLTMTVPPLPTDKLGQLFIWPGLQTVSSPATLLQPLLVFSNSGGCLQDAQLTQAETNYGTWYVEGYDESPTPCGMGNAMAVNPGDTLTMSIVQSSPTTWLQSITDKTINQSVTLSSTVAAGTTFPLAGLNIESDGGNTGLTTSAPVGITNITLTLANPQAGDWCTPYSLGPTDTETTPVVSPSNTAVCTISKVTLNTGPTTDGTSKN